MGMSACSCPSVAVWKRPVVDSALAWGFLSSFDEAGCFLGWVVMLSSGNGRLSATVYRQHQQPSARAFEQLLKRCSKERHPEQRRQEGVSAFSPDVNVGWAWQDARPVLSYLLHAPCCQRPTAPLTCSFPGNIKRTRRETRTIEPGAWWSNSANRHAAQL